MYQPCAHDTNIESSKKCGIALCIWPQVTDYFVFAFFTIEMCIKMTAMGIFGDNLNLSAIRTARVLCPLRAIKRVPSVRILVMLLLDTLHNYALFDDFPLQSFYIPPDQDSFICFDPSSSEMTKCSEILQSRRDNMICELDFHSLTLLLTNKTINRSWLAIFQIITFENWINIMYYIQDAHSFCNWIYFVCLIVIGSFFMMNLCLVVISTQFHETKK
ncbi:unnamed protein product, partial [Rotaria sordida]